MLLHFRANSNHISLSPIKTSDLMAQPPGKQPLLAELFAAHTLNTRYEDLTSDAIAQTKVFILDTLGVGIAGSSAFGADIVINTGITWGQGEEATLWGRSQRGPAGLAALVNGYQVHCQEYDSVHEGAVLHPLATTMSAALAYAERIGNICGKELIVACAVGVNIAAGLGIASKSAMAFFRPATAGGFGATAAVGRLMGLSSEALIQAFGIQYAQTSGTLQPHVEGSASLPLQVGLNSRAALQSCDLSRAGLPGLRDVFEGPYGYLRLFEGPEPWDLTGTYQCLAGQRWLISELSHKPYPAGRATHGGIEGLMILMKKENGSILKPDEIERVTITGPPVTARLCARPDISDPSPNYARLCMSYIGAKVLINGFIDLAHYRSMELKDLATHALAQRIIMVSDGQEDPNALVPISIEMRLVNGQIHNWKCEQMLASPSRRLTREQHLNKFRRCWEFAAEPLPDSSREALIAMVDNLESIHDLRQLTALLAPPTDSVMHDGSRL
jgi:aconitate decarboxylase